MKGRSYFYEALGCLAVLLTFFTSDPQHRGHLFQTAITLFIGAAVLRGLDQIDRKLK